MTYPVRTTTPPATTGRRVTTPPATTPRANPFTNPTTPPGTGTGSSPGTGTGTDTGSTNYDQDAYTFLLNLLTQWGISQLAPTVLQFLQQGYTTDSIPILLQDTDAYKQRFSGNEERKRLGLQVLSPAEYLAAEESYRNIMQAAGLPQGFYDQSSDFAGFIGRDVSPTEVQRRVDAAVQTSNTVDQGWLNQFQDFYGIGKNELAAYFLDPERGMDILNKALRGTTIAAAAGAKGVNLSKDQAELYGAAANANTYQQQASQYANAASTGTKLGQIYGQNYNPDVAAQQVFSGSVEAADLLDKLAGLEKSEFGGNSGISTTALKSRSQY